MAVSTISFTRNNKKDMKVEFVCLLVVIVVVVLFVCLSVCFVVVVVFGG